jgi:hypothetical protein
MTVRGRAGGLIGTEVGTGTVAPVGFVGCVFGRDVGEAEPAVDDTVRPDRGRVVVTRGTDVEAPI